MIRRFAAVFVCLLLLLPPVTAFASVANTEESTAGSTVYIAGNPDLYPIEYYDTQSETYKGILPDLYAQISQRTGISFTYIRAGLTNEQQRLAKNKQVEIVSAHRSGDVTALQDSQLLLSYQKDGQSVDVMIGFTAIAGEELITLLKSEIQAIPDSTLLALSLQVAADDRNTVSVWWFVGAAALVVILTVVFVTVLVRQKRKEKKSRENTRIDSLTGIGNAVYFEQNYKNHIPPEACSLYYITYISLDFEWIEQYQGSAAATELQLFAANTLSTTAKDTDFVCRFRSGIFLYALQSPSRLDAETALQELLRKLNQHQNISAAEQQIAFRAGVFHLPSANIPLETALLNARQGYDHALRTQQSVVFADKQLLQQEAVKAKLYRSLANALNNKEIEIYLQFIVSAKTGQIKGAEALSRWQSPENGILSPAHYIQAMTDSGIIDRLDLYILEEACRQLEEWSSTSMQNLWLSCNFTRSTVSREDFLARFEEVVAKYRFDRKKLVIELTEDTLADNTAVAYRNILALKKQGYFIALDDLGSGYSSFSDLCDYPIDMIKIDRHIVAKSSMARGKALLSGLVELAHGLDIRVLCEGVETDTENKIVKQANCDYIQGYFYSRVLPKEEAPGFFTKF